MRFRDHKSMHFLSVGNCSSTSHSKKLYRSQSILYSFLRCVSCLQRATPSHRKFFHCRYGGSHKAEHGPHAPEASGALPWPGSQPVTRTVAFVIAAKASSAQWPEHDRLWQSDATSSVAKQLKQRPFNTRGTRRPCLTRWWSFMRGHTSPRTSTVAWASCDVNPWHDHRGQPRWAHLHRPLGIGYEGPSTTRRTTTWTLRRCDRLPIALLGHHSEGGGNVPLVGALLLIKWVVGRRIKPQPLRLWPGGGCRGTAKKVEIITAIQGAFGS